MVEVMEAVGMRGVAGDEEAAATVMEEGSVITVGGPVI